MQMIPATGTIDQEDNNEIAIPCAVIMDYPRFAWRGLMLDVSRHFFTKQEVMDYIDEMSRYKYNMFHWHLTDDEGWRLQIKAYPRLTSVGAWNVKKIGYFGTFSPVTPEDKYDYGGFYTQDDIREVIEYAKEHFVNILPELDMPGHSMAAIASYPELSCTTGADKYHVRSGEKGFMDWTDSGIVAHYDNTLCPANPRVYEFLDTVFAEVASLFPFPYIHIGGDECAKTFWKINPAIKALMKREDLKNMDEVQSYFEKRVEKIVESKGKKVIGWDEILEGGVAPNATIMSWRGEKGGIKASQMHHDVIMSPTTYAYLDYMQGDPALEPRVYASLRLKKAYQFDPVPAGADAKYIKGGQANLWAEQLYNIRHAQYMTWPRGFAIAEALWSPKDKKNWTSFVERVEAQFPRLDADSVKYARSMYDPDIAVTLNTDSTLRITLSKELNNIDLYYSVDNSFPDNFYPKYDEPFNMPKDAAMLRVISYREGKPIGRLITITTKDLRKRSKK
jgi:hexosaminidase